nr:MULTISPECIES: sugar ABC transporter ATP-binding protein [unclassified Nocardioides]
MTPVAQRSGLGISARGVGKSYGGVSVLRDVDLDVRPGEILGLVGENGAGKSTLLRVLAGSIRPDTGEVLLNGEPAGIRTPKDAISRGVSLISQELALVPARTVLENVFLGSWDGWAGGHGRARDLQTFQRLQEETGFRLAPDAIVASLPIGRQQQVEILKALARGAQVLALDEPTAVLAGHEKEGLLDLIRKLAEGGTTVVFVSHFLDEVLSIADRVAVLRDGDLVATDDASSHQPASLVAMMVGRQVDVMYPTLPPVPEDAPVALSVEGLSRGMVRDVSLQVRAGEILGVAGLVGSGRSELLRMIFGADTPAAGRVLVHGAPLKAPSPARAMAAGLALVPESRKEQGLALTRSVRDNVAAPTLSRRRLGPFAKRKAERRAVADVARRVDLRAKGLGVPIWTLSGGNQQKALFAKWLLTEPSVLLVDEPTRGVDVVAKQQIHGLIVDLAASGVAVVVVSSEVEEVLGLAHRVVVMRRGRAVAEFAQNAAAGDVVAAAFGDEARNHD